VTQSADLPVAEDQLKPALAGMLFIAAEPIPISVLARTTGWPPGKVRTCLEELAADLEGRGLNLQITDKAVQLATDPAVAEVIRRFLGKADDGRLSRGALETLSIVAFKQPVQRTTIEAMRGVNSDYMIGRLKERDLIAEVGRANGQGRPCLYGTTFKFLEHFGLSSPADLELTALLGSNGSTADYSSTAASVPPLAAAEAALGV
jgi:segregation and condensation protein B